VTVTVPEVKDAAEEIFQPVFAGMPPGPGLALLLGSQDHSQLDDFDLVEFTRSARRLASWAAAIEFGAIAELSARRKKQGERLGAWDSQAGEWVIEEIAAALTLSGGVAAHQVAMAGQFTETIPDTWRALEDGRIDRDKAKTIADGVCLLPDETARRVEERVLPAAPGQTCAQLRAAIRKAVLEIDPDAYAKRRRQAEEDRSLELRDNDDGTSDIYARSLPAQVASAVYNRVNAIAQALKADGDPRTIDQLRVDVLADLARNHYPCLHAPARPDGTPKDGAPADGAADRPGGVPDEQASACSGNSPSGARDGEGDTPGDAPDTGTEAPADGDNGGLDSGDDAGSNDADEDERAVAAGIAEALRGQLTDLTDRLGDNARTRNTRAALVAEAARRMKDVLTDLKSRWCATTANRDGDIIRHGADSYRPPAKMLRDIQNRDGTCVFPGCRISAVKCDADHTVAYHKGGPTCRCNVASLCRRHHRLKQRPEWQLHHIWPGVLVWIAPTGHWYVTGPDG
jgi:hypothetical protein